MNYMVFVAYCIYFDLCSLASLLFLSQMGIEILRDRPL